jgi:hypothetical protein
MTPGAGLLPVVRYFVLCEEVQFDPPPSTRTTLIGMLDEIRLPADASFPYLHQEFSTFARLTACRGPGDGWIEVVHADSGTLIHRTQRRRLQFRTHPLFRYGVHLPVRRCPFPRAGLFWVQLWYNQPCSPSNPFL